MPKLILLPLLRLALLGILLWATGCGEKEKPVPPRGHPEPKIGWEDSLAGQVVQPAEVQQMEVAPKDVDSLAKLSFPDTATQAKEKSPAGKSPAKGPTPKPSRDVAGDAFLKVLSSPAFARITVNDLDWGNTPMDSYRKLAPGPVGISLEHRKHGKKDTTVTLTAGDSLALKIKFP